MSQDDLDQKILEILQKNGKLTNEEIGKLLGRSPSTIRDRIKRMEEDRTIIGYSAVVDEARVGIGADAYILADLPPEKEMNAMSGLLDIENVTEVIHTTGERRFMFRVMAENDSELLSLVDRKIRPLGFENLEIMRVLDHVIRNPGI
ncbi:MAG: Lrp/AsnC family transcriptional regulator [Methanomassiliicoccales archaeon]|nr:MAG: Lrp/AsnC family transcriptional regulator [Methanomassiliicoccales archaeon]